MAKTEKLIKRVCKNINALLQHKNKNYGDSAVNPLHIFSKTNTYDQICMQIDHKINRIKNSDKLCKNDVVDLIGYLILLCVQKRWLDFSDLMD